MVQTAQNPMVASPLLVYCLLVLVGLIGALGDVTVNQWARSNQIWWWIVSCFVWVLAATIFGSVLKLQHFTFGVAVVLALLVHSLCVLAFDYAWYKASLSRWQWLGVVCAILALCCVELGRRPVAPSQNLPAVKREVR